MDEQVQPAAPEPRKSATRNVLRWQALPVLAQPLVVLVFRTEMGSTTSLPPALSP